jgi:hypothetical protein
VLCSRQVFEVSKLAALDWAASLPRGLPPGKLTDQTACPGGLEPPPLLGRCGSRVRLLFRDGCGDCAASDIGPQLVGAFDQLIL